MIISVLKIRIKNTWKWKNKLKKGGGKKSEFPNATPLLLLHPHLNHTVMAMAAGIHDEAKSLQETHATVQQIIRLFAKWLQLWASLYL